jgi:hypothetical protein
VLHRRNSTRPAWAGGTHGFRNRNRRLPREAPRHRHREQMLPRVGALHAPRSRPPFLARRAGPQSSSAHGNRRVSRSAFERVPRPRRTLGFQRHRPSSYECFQVTTQGSCAQSRRVCSGAFERVLPRQRTPVFQRHRPSCEDFHVTTLDEHLDQTSRGPFAGRRQDWLRRVVGARRSRRCEGLHLSDCPVRWSTAGRSRAIPLCLGNQLSGLRRRQSQRLIMRTAVAGEHRGMNDDAHTLRPRGRAVLIRRPRAAGQPPLNGADGRPPVSGARRSGRRWTISRRICRQVHGQCDVIQRGLQNRLLCAGMMVCGRVPKMDERRPRGQPKPPPSISLHDQSPQRSGDTTAAIARACHSRLIPL